MRGNSPLYGVLPGRVDDSSVSTLGAFGEHVLDASSHVDARPSTIELEYDYSVAATMAVSSSIG